MQFFLTKDELDFQESLRKALVGGFPCDLLRKQFDTRGVFERKLWSVIENLGVFEYFSPNGGGTFRELSLFAFEVGRTLFPWDIGEMVFLTSFCEDNWKTVRKSGSEEIISWAPASGSDEIRFVPNIPLVRYHAMYKDGRVSLVGTSAGSAENCLDRTTSRSRVSTTGEPLIQLEEIGSKRILEGNIRVEIL